jgi:hypothetical protein
MKFPIRNTFETARRPTEDMIKPNTTVKIRGLGDVVEVIATPIKNLLLKTGNSWVKEMLGDCNCTRRREILNEKFPIGNKKCHD